MIKVRGRERQELCQKRWEMIQEKDCEEMIMKSGEGKKMVFLGIITPSVYYFSIASKEERK